MVWRELAIDAWRLADGGSASDNRFCYGGGTHSGKVGDLRLHFLHGARRADSGNERQGQASSLDRDRSRQGIAAQAVIPWLLPLAVGLAAFLASLLAQAVYYGRVVQRVADLEAALNRHDTDERVQWEHMSDMRESLGKVKGHLGINGQ